MYLYKSNDIELYLKAAPRLELGIEDLQSTALPLGYTAKIHILYAIINIIVKSNLLCNYKKIDCLTYNCL